MKLQIKYRYFGTGIRDLARILRGRGSAIEFMLAFDEIETAYSNELKDRYLKFSVGEGNWPPLAESTIKRKGNSDILVDTMQMITEFNPVIARTENVLHPKNREGTGLVIQTGLTGIYPNGTPVDTVATYHQQGTARMPARKLLVGPTSRLRRKTADIVEKYIGIFLKNREKLTS